MAASTDSRMSRTSGSLSDRCHAVRSTSPNVLPSAPSSAPTSCHDVPLEEPLGSFLNNSAKSSSFITTPERTASKCKTLDFLDYHLRRMDSRVRVGIVGAGGFTVGRMLPNLVNLPGAEVTIVANRSRESGDNV